MPELTRPDGAQIHWDERGEGPSLHVLNNVLTATPDTFDAVLTELASDHRVVTWDPRGAGQSTHNRPYDLVTDANDLIALIEEGGAPTVMISFGLVPSSLVAADLRPELVAAVVMVGGLGLSGGTDPDSVIDSESVATAGRQMASTDPRGLQRAMIALGNPQLDEVGVRARLEAQLAYCPVESWVERVESYLGYDARHACAALADRLWLVHWASPMSGGHSMEHMQALLPNAHIVELEDGPISRPDLTASVVRGLTTTLRAR